MVPCDEEDNLPLAELTKTWQRVQEKFNFRFRIQKEKQQFT